MSYNDADRWDPKVRDRAAALRALDRVAERTYTSADLELIEEFIKRLPT